MDSIKYVKGFSKIKIKPICEKVGVNRSNLLTGRVSIEKANLVKQEIESEIAKLYLRDDENGEREKEDNERYTDSNPYRV